MTMMSTLTAAPRPQAAAAEVSVVTPEPLDDAPPVATGLETLQRQAKALALATRALAPLAKDGAMVDLVAADRQIARAARKLAAIEPSPKVARQLLADAEAWVQRRRQSLRLRLERDLGPACAKAGLSLRVVSHEPRLQLRIAPFAVEIDAERGVATLLFAREVVATCAADAAAIVETHQRALAALDGPFDAAAFFDRCVAAWRAARVALGVGERVELLDFLPFLTLLRQPPAFRAAPSRARYQDYSRAQFAYDILRLRRGVGLERDGWRLGLGVATGTSASQKRRVIYLEDEQGQGEYKLTVQFTRVEVL